MRELVRPRLAKYGFTSNVTLDTIQRIADIVRAAKESKKADVSFVNTISSTDFKVYTNDTEFAEYVRSLIGS